MLAVALVMGGSGVASATATAQASRYAAIVVDADTGDVLYERNADLPRHPASLTKIMTLYLTFEAMAAKKLSAGDLLPVSALAAGQDPSRLDLPAGSKLKVEDAIRAITTKSANDAACVLAEALGKGSEQHFIDAMNAKAKALGLAHTTFKNPSGLPDDGHIMSARDLATLCRALIHDFPTYYSYFSTDSFDFKGTRYPNQNRFLHTYYGADGIKTGFVNASGHNLAASAVRGGKRLIAIVLGGDTQAWTREHATRLLDVAYAKIDPSLVMVAGNAPDDADEGASEGTAVAAAPAAAGGAPTAAAATTAVATSESFSTPAGAVTLASAQALALPNGTANLLAYASPTPGPVGSRPEAPDHPQAAGYGAASAAPSSAPSASSPPHSPGRPNSGATAELASATTHAELPLVTSQAPATEEVTEGTIERELMTGTAAPNAPVETRLSRAEHTAGRVPGESSPAAARTNEAPSRQQAAPSPSSPDRAKAAAASAPVSAAGADTIVPASDGSRGWSVQVGLFRDATIARRRGEEARSLMPAQIRGADLVIGRAVDGVHVTSRISRLTEQDARLACSELERGRVPCIVIPPGHPLVVATN
ncbi:MAG TPA: D-alanyl-D-alanine carboxypeptidase family protein [Candidatus Binatia bacterium]|jgi:D-alanyl-D-alanine carboxypeptidase